VPDILDGGGAEAVLKNIYVQKSKNKDIGLAKSVAGQTHDQCWFSTPVFVS